MAASIVTKCETDWYKLLSVTEKGNSKSIHKAIVKETLKNDPGVLSDWDKSFLMNMASWDRPLSDKQNEVLQRLVNKVVEALEVGG